METLGLRMLPSVNKLHFRTVAEGGGGYGLAKQSYLRASILIYRKEAASLKHTVLVGRPKLGKECSIASGD